MPPELSSTTPADTSINISLTINEKFDLSLTNPDSKKYSRYKSVIEKVIDDNYQNIAGYKPGSAILFRFRPGSVIADITIKTTATYELDFGSVNSNLSRTLTAEGYKLAENIVAKSEEYDLVQNPGKIYPLQEMQLNCNPPDGAKGDINWRVDGVDPLLNPAKYNILKNNHTLKVRRVSAEDSGPGSGCITYNYTMQQQECESHDKNVTFTCHLADASLSALSYSSKTVTLRTTKNAFNCSDSKFGVGVVNQTAFRHCEGGNAGIQWAVCSPMGEWRDTSNNCTLRVLQDLADRAEHLEVTDVRQFVANLSSTAEKHSENITKVSATLLKVVDLLRTIASFSQSAIIDKDIMKDFLKTVDVIASEEAQATWKTLNIESTSRNVSSALLQLIEIIGGSLSNEPFLITTPRIQLIRTFLNSSFQELSGINSTTKIDIPHTSGSNMITIIVLSAFHNVLPVRTAAHSNGSQRDTRINGDVVVIKMDPNTYNISLYFNVKNNTLGNPQCVFWNFSLLDGTGGWDSTGCELKDSGKGSNTVTCECTHTTSFSILMSPFSANSFALSYITYIGLVISIGSLLLCLIIETIVWKPLTRNDTSYMRHVSIVNIAVSLLIADICFFIGASIVERGQVTPLGPCSAVTFFIHFFYLVLFFWMFLSALLLLYRTIMVFSGMSRSRMLAIAFSVGYGAPLLIAVITVASTAGNRGYVQEMNSCWLNWDQTKALLAFVIPALTIVVINMMVLIVVLCAMLRRGVGAITQPDEKHTMLVIARCVAILTPLFGLTWGFGIGTMVSSHFGIHAVFAFLNSLQGFFILVFGPLLDNKIQEKFLGKLKFGSFSSNLTRANHAGSSPSNGKYSIYRFHRRFSTGDTSNIYLAEVLIEGNASLDVSAFLSGLDQLTIDTVTIVEATMTARLVSIDVPPHKVCYNSQYTMNCGMEEKMDTCTWQITRPDQDPQIIGAGAKQKLERRTGKILPVMLLFYMPYK
ncbi:adhesion G protein-coupled receptor F4-like [Electrophorus electricus]|uniref:adhesion G protein-coupled receptor F4-like n=1 Tax=Electrophorus electricus TaxID=8005 RepID=UPI0015D087D2|nr:adhesion G protein-coupled receptor F4-like [Electrophorus electricus]